MIGILTMFKCAPSVLCSSHSSHNQSRKENLSDQTLTLIVEAKGAIAGGREASELTACE